MSSVVFVAGARPNFMKVAPLLRAARRRGVPAELVHTGQHYDFAMSGVFLDQLGLPVPDAHLDVGAAPRGAQLGRIMVAFEAYLRRRATPPAAIVVVGDVDSTAACALAGSAVEVPIVHVEAGLRSFDRTMPEERNRIVTDAVSELLLVSEPSGLANLAREGVDERRVRYVGNVMIDTLEAALPAARALNMVERLGLAPGGYAVVTLHRPSNVDVPDRLAACVELVRSLATDLDVVFPVHPRTAGLLAASGLDAVLAEIPRLRAIPPLGYHEFLGLLAEARLAVTDSGGIQEETTHLAVPCVTLRANTERPVTTTEGTNRLAGEEPGRAWLALRDALAAPRRPAPVIRGWDGHAAERALDAIVELVTSS